MKFGLIELVTAVSLLCIIAVASVRYYAVSSCEARGGEPMTSARYFRVRMEVKCYDPKSLKEM